MTGEPEPSPGQGFGDPIDKADWERAGVVADGIHAGDVGGHPERTRWDLNVTWRQQRLNADVKDAQGGQLSLTGRDLRGLNLGAADLRGADLTGAIWD